MNNDFDFVLDSDISQDDFPAWLSELVFDMENRLFPGYILYGNIEDLFELKGELVDIETYLRRIFHSKRCVFLDPALGVVSNGGIISDNSKGPFDALFNFLVSANIGREEGIVVIRGGEMWLKEEVAWAVKRIAEQGVVKEGCQIVILSETPTLLPEVLAQSTFFKRIEIPFPSINTIKQTLVKYKSLSPRLFEDVDLDVGSEKLSGTKLFPLVNLLKSKVSLGESISLSSLEAVKRKLVEETCEGLLEFVVPNLNLDDLYGMNKLKLVIRRDLEMWTAGEKSLIPKGYLLIGPVGTGKTYFVEALAGEAGVPVIKFNNFRSAVPGQTERNLEKIFRMLRSLSRCFVFIDEADQAMGSRTSGADGVAGRVYSLFAQEMASEKNRGKIIWIMATSQPHKLEPDLKRPGRMDLKIPLLPCENAPAAFQLLIHLGEKKGLKFATPEVEAAKFQERDRIMSEDNYILAAVPDYITPASATVIVDSVARKKKTLSGKVPSDRELLRIALRDHQPAIAKLVMQEQCRLAVREATDIDFVPHEYQYLQTLEKPFTIL